MHLFGWLFEWDEHRMDRGRSCSSAFTPPPQCLPTLQTAVPAVFQLQWQCHSDTQQSRCQWLSTSISTVIEATRSLVKRTAWWDSISRWCLTLTTMWARIVFLVFLVVGKCFCCILIFPPLAAPPPVVWVISGAHALGYPTVLNARETIYPMYFLTHADNYAL